MIVGGVQWEQRLRRLEQGLRTLPDKPEESPQAALRALWFLAAGTRLSVQAAAERQPPQLDAAQLQALDAWIDRRLQGEPLAYLLERQGFMGLELLCGPVALIPRRETEMLGQAAVALLREAAQSGHEPCCIDVCCGSGNLALAVAHAVPTARVHASDLSPQALQLAAANVARLGLQSRVQLHEGDLLAPFDGAQWSASVDLLLSAPPYISSARMEALPSEIISHEPAMAFDGGPFGIDMLMRLLRRAPRLLRAGGWLCVEVGLGQGPAMGRLARGDARYSEVRMVLDEQGNERVLLARRAAAGSDA